MANLWTQPSGTLLGDLEEQITLSGLDLPLTDNSATVEKISGDLPPGLRINGTQIVGTPHEVARVQEHRFVLRATLDGQISDRTFRIKINGPDAPTWITEPGLLPVGNNDTFYILDSAPIDFQLQATDKDLQAGQTLEYYIGSGDGELPPGISLTADGRIVGVVDPILAIEKGLLYAAGTYDTAPYDLTTGGYDFALPSSNGFDSYYYDTTTFDYNAPVRPPKKLNRYYQFTVSVTDGDTIERRTFRIYVVGDDFFRADNTVMQVGTGTFTADNSNVRVPIWLTPSDLGVKRANNYVTLFLDTIDTNTQVGVVSYHLEKTNPGTYQLKTTGEIIRNGRYDISGVLPTFPKSQRGPTNVDLVGDPDPIQPSEWRVLEPETVSALPPGLALDPTNGEVAGRVPYQSEVTKDFKFSVRAWRFTPDQPEPVEDAGTFKVGKLYTIVDVGTTNFVKIGAPQNLAGVTFRATGQGAGTGTARKIENYADKTFTIKLLGEIDSETHWITDSDLGSISSNYISVLRVEAITNIPSGRLLYSVSEGRLPPGLSLTFDGEIVGQANPLSGEVYKSLWKASTEAFPRLYQAGDIVKYNGKYYTTNSNHQASSVSFESDSTLWAEYTFGPKGLTVFDNDTFRLDNNETTIDRVYEFTVLAEDQYKYTNATRTFKISVSDPDNKKYTNVFMKPYFSEEKRSTLNAFLSDPEIFIPEYIYRPGDPNFGIQKEFKMLVYAGIEAKEIEEFARISSKNHKRKKYRIGELKTAIANVPGSTDSVYEVLYLDIIDPQDSKNGRTQKSIKLKTGEKLNVNTVGATPKNIFYEFDERPTFTIQLRNRTVKVTLGEEFQVYTREDGEIAIQWANGFVVDSRTESNLLQILRGLGPTMTFRPEYANTIKADSDAVNVSQTTDNIRYISNVTNMRDSLRDIGTTERGFVPLWMRTPQPGEVNELGYTTAIVLCYCQPGTSEIIKAAIEARDFDFRQFGLDFDRYIIDNPEGSSEQQYILFANYRFNV